MRTPHFTLNATDVQGHAQKLLADQLHLHDYKPACSARLLYSIVLFAAATANTIATACRNLRLAPSDQTVYDALDATLPQRVELQKRINASLRESVPKSLRKGKRKAKVAIDLSLLPYYGKVDPKDDMVYVGQEKASTHNHHAYATVYLVRKRQRFTLAMIMVRHDTPWDQVVKELLQLARKVVPAIELVLLDRGFYSVAVIRYLQHARTPFIMPIIGRGNRANHPKGPSGSNVFFSWKKSGWGSYTLTDHSGKNKATFDVAVKVRRKWAKRPGSKKKGKRVLVYACWGVKGKDERWVDAMYRRRRIDWVKQTYRGRFGIETSYRQMNQGRAWTTSTKPARRLLLVGLALLLRNLWALLHYSVIRQPDRQDELTLPDMLAWIAEGIKDTLGFRTEIELQHRFVL